MAHEGILDFKHTMVDGTVVTTSGTTCPQTAAKFDPDEEHDVNYYRTAFAKNNNERISYYDVALNKIMTAITSTVVCV